MNTLNPILSGCNINNTQGVVSFLYDPSISGYRPYATTDIVTNAQITGATVTATVTGLIVTNPAVPISGIITTTGIMPVNVTNPVLAISGNVNASLTGIIPVNFTNTFIAISGIVTETGVRSVSLTNTIVPISGNVTLTNPLIAISGYTTVNGSVSITNALAVTGVVTVSEQVATVLNSGQVILSSDNLLLPANPNRKLLFIQNHSTSGELFVSFSGAADATNCSRILKAATVAGDGGIIESEHLPFEVYCSGALATSYSLWETY